MIHRLLPFVPPGVPAWTWAKFWLGASLGLADDTLHMMTGLIILTLAALVLRRAPWTWVPWATVLIAESLNEAYDLTHGADEGNWRDSWHDFWLTLLWPTIILAVYRRWGAAPAEAEPSEAPPTVPTSGDEL